MNWPWPDCLDAIAAAPKHHGVLLENPRVRVLDTRAHPAAPPKILWSPPLPPHTLENVGTSELHIMSIEIKEP